MSHAIPTLNQCGYQMGTPTPLLQEWLSSYDGEHPLLDIGCAYGINTFKSLECGIPTVSVDPEEKHLAILRKKLDPKYRHLLTCVKGELPDNIAFPDSHFSGILCADVLHFLDGEALEKSIATIQRKLIPGGRFVLTMTSDKLLGFIDKDEFIRFHQDLKLGLKWPGAIRINKDFNDKIANIFNDERLRLEHYKTVPRLLHFCSKEQLVKEICRNGFKVIFAELGEHTGHQDPKGIGQLPGRSLQVIAEEM